MNLCEHCSADKRYCGHDSKRIDLADIGENFARAMLEKMLSDYSMGRQNFSAEQARAIRAGLIALELKQLADNNG